MISRILMSKLPTAPRRRDSSAPASRSLVLSDRSCSGRSDPLTKVRASPAMGKSL